jgi:predicted O-methyltransferase YrrM
VNALEIAGFEGRSTVWLLENVLTHPDATLTWIDTFAGGAEHAGIDLSGLEVRFRANVARFGDKVRGHVGRSQDVLRGLSGGRFDLVYVDCSHAAADVLTDAVMALPLLVPGGILGFDDYGWRGSPDTAECPAAGIDAFLGAIRGNTRNCTSGIRCRCGRTNER